MIPNVTGGACATTYANLYQEDKSMKKSEVSRPPLPCRDLAYQTDGLDRITARQVMPALEQAVVHYLHTVVIRSIRN